MLVECPNCHRRYEPKPNEKYCPCCGEEIKEPLKNIEQEPRVITKEVERPRYIPSKSNVGKILSLFALLAAFVSFVFAFGPAFYGGSNSIIQLTFYSKQPVTSSSSQPQAYIGLIIAFVIYMIMFIVAAYEIYKVAKDEGNAGRIAVGVIEVFLVLFYAIYLTEKSKVTGSYYGYGSSSTTTTVALGDGSIRMLVTLGASALLNFISPILDN